MIVIILIALALSILFWWYRNDVNSPPGPRGLPILGYYPFLGANKILALREISEKYGPIMKINLLNENFYVLNSVEAIVEAFDNKGDVFSGRPRNEFYLFNVMQGEKSIATSEGEPWKIQRNFMINKLVGLGMGKTDFGYTIHDLCDDLVTHIEEETELRNLSAFLSNFNSNVISTILYGKKYQPTDPVYKELAKNVAEMMGTGTELYFFISGRVTEFLVKTNKRLWNNFMESRDRIHEFMYDRIKERIEKGVTGEFNDILDYCIKEMNGPNADLFTKENIVRNFLLMFIAGADTTSSTLHFAFYYMATNPDIQQKVYKELIDVFGTEHRVLFHEITKLHYTRAVIDEIQRMSCVLPLGVMHVNTEEATICGYRFPKRSKFIANIHALSRDERYFKNPKVFNPNNFLDANGNYVSVVANMPFGIGKRKCLGYKLAEMEIFIAFARLVKEFEWLPPKDEEIKFKMNNAFIRHISPYKIVAKRRK